MRRLVGATCLIYHGGVGDHLMLTTVARELKRHGGRYVFIVSEYPDLFLGNRDFDGVAAPGSRRAWAFMKLAGDRTIAPTYLINHNPLTEVPRPAARARPGLHVPDGRDRRADRPAALRHPGGAGARLGAPYRGCIAIQSSGLSGKWLLLNKQWFPERFAEVAAHLIKSHPVVQIGSPSDPPSPAPTTSAAAPRSGSSRRCWPTAACTSASRACPCTWPAPFNCPSVIVYGGRLRPDQIGYVCNESLYNAVECAPCWLDTRCDFGRYCLDMITTGAVIEAAERMLARPRGPLAVESYEILGPGSREARPLRSISPETSRSPSECERR